MLEVRDGRRALSQLEKVSEPDVRRYLRVVSRRVRSEADHRVARLMSVRVCQPHALAAEVSAVYRLAGRSRALVARLERADAVARDAGNGWRCLFVRLG